jgi:HD-like signal output (HDOD) protein
MPAREAVTLMLGVLDALAAAHEAGVVHRDLKPSNILLGRDGRARVMDFGIAARVAARNASHDGRIVGTPGYISPEAARGEAPMPTMDVFAAGLLLGELLNGAPLLRDTDPYRALERVQREDLVLPPKVQADGVLRGILQRALSRTVAERYDSARSMHRALQAWLTPEAGAVAEKSSPATLEFLLRRMRHKSDFPALSSSVVRIQRVTTSETESLRVLSEEILKDVALTNTLLRMVNTAQFTAVAGGGISTVSRAVALVGFAGIRNMALSVVLLEHMQDKTHAVQLKEEFLRALTAGTLADELTPQARDAEEAFLGAMFQNLGRLLTECYLPDEALQIRQALGDKKHTPAGALQRDREARRVLGMNLDELGSGVAKAWGLPDMLQTALRAPEGEVPTREQPRGPERMRWLGRSANAMADAMLGHDGEAQAAALQAAAEMYCPALGLNPRDMVAAAYATRSRINQLAKAMSVHVAPGAPARRLLESTADPVVALPRPASPARVQSQADAEADTLQLPPGTTMAQVQLTQALEGLRSLKSPRLPDVLQRVLDGMHRAVGFRCVVLCLREPGTTRLAGRIGLGPGASEISAAFRFSPDSLATGDLFAWLSAKGADLLVSNAASVAARIPAWYRQRVNAPTFLLLPMMRNGIPIGMIYADKLQAETIVLSEAELALLRALRDEGTAACIRGIG